MVVFCLGILGILDFLEILSFLDFLDFLEILEILEILDYLGFLEQPALIMGNPRGVQSACRKGRENICIGCIVGLGFRSFGGPKPCFLLKSRGVGCCFDKKSVPLPANISPI